MQIGQTLPLARYRFSFRMEDTLELPDFAGSLLRGQFGAALRRLVCLTGQVQCSRCPLYRSCMYPAIFETPPPAEHELQQFSAVPNPYVIEPPPFGTKRVARGATLDFAVVLLGRSLAQLPLIVMAFQRALLQGLGPKQARAHLEDVMLEPAADPPRSVWDPHALRVLAHAAHAQVPELPRLDRATLRISTPLRLQSQGHALGPDKLHPRALLTAIMRRISLLFEMHADLPRSVPNPSDLAQLALELQDDRRLQWRDWSRFSSRQQQSMTLGGVVGEWTLRGELQPFAPLLWIGQWLHAGKNATMGMGKYEVVFE